MTEDFEVPGAPTADQIRAEIVRTADPRFWRPFSEQDGTATDLTRLTPSEAARVIAARHTAGPGPSGNAYQHALHEHMKALGAKEKERDRLFEELTAVTGYDPQTGEGRDKLSQDQKTQLTYRLSQVQSEIARLDDPTKSGRVNRALEEAVKVQQARYRSEYIEAEAKRRAAQSAVDAEIERRAAGYRKTQPQP